MAMNNPPHPGEFIDDLYLAPYGVSSRRFAELLDVAPSTLTRLIRAQSAVTPEMALRLSIALGRSPESWLAMHHTRKHLNLRRVRNLDLDAA